MSTSRWSANKRHGYMQQQFIAKLRSTFWHQLLVPEWESAWCSTSLNLQERQSALSTTRRIALKACEVTWSEPWTIHARRKPHTFHLMPSDTAVHCPFVSELVQQPSPCAQLRVLVGLSSLQWQLLRMQFSTRSSYVPSVTTFHAQWCSQACTSKMTLSVSWDHFAYR